MDRVKLSLFWRYSWCPWRASELPTATVQCRILNSTKSGHCERRESRTVAVRETLFKLRRFSFSFRLVAPVPGQRDGGRDEKEKRPDALGLVGSELKRTSFADIGAKEGEETAEEQPVVTEGMQGGNRGRGRFEEAEEESAAWQDSTTAGHFCICCSVDVVVFVVFAVNSVFAVVALLPNVEASISRCTRFGQASRI